MTAALESRASSEFHLHKMAKRLQSAEAGSYFNFEKKSPLEVAKMYQPIWEQFQGFIKKSGGLHPHPLDQTLPNEPANIYDRELCSYHVHSRIRKIIMNQLIFYQNRLLACSPETRDNYTPIYWEACPMQIKNPEKKPPEGSRDISAYPYPKPYLSCLDFVASEIDKNDADTFSVLDVGCMDGTAMEQLKKFSQIYLSQNILVSGLSLYRLRNPFLDHFFALPIELLHIKDKYNLIISNFAFCYFSFPNTALQNMLAALKPGGKLVCNISFIPYGCDADITINMINALADYQDSTANFQKQLETRFRHLHIFLDQLSHDKNYIISTTSVTIPDGCGTGIMIEKNDQ